MATGGKARHSLGEALAKPDGDGQPGEPIDKNNNKIIIIFMKVFHYSKVSDWRDIAYKTETKKETGLRPGRRLGTKYMPAWNRAAIFALLSPIPKEWTNNEDFSEGKSPWETLHRHVGKLLLEVDIDPCVVQVVDWGHREGFLRGANDNPDFRVPDQYAHKTRIEAEQAYLESAISLQQYLDDHIRFSIPEVLIEHHVPMSQIRVSDDQSLLEEYLRTVHPDWIQGEIALMKFVPALAPLIKKIRNRLKSKMNLVKTKRSRRNFWVAD